MSNTNPTQNSVYKQTAPAKLLPRLGAYPFLGSPPEAYPEGSSSANIGFALAPLNRAAGDNWAVLDALLLGVTPGSIVPIEQASSTEVNVTTPTTVTTTAIGEALYAVSLSMECVGNAPTGHTVTAALSWTSPLTAHSQACAMALDTGTSNLVVETFPILCAANTPITVTFTYGGGATNDPYTYSIRLVVMP